MATVVPPITGSTATGAASIATGADSSIISCIKENSIILSVAIYLIVIFYFMTKNKDEKYGDILYSQTNLYIIIFILPLIVGIIYSIKKFNSNGGIDSNGEISYTQYMKYGVGIFIFIIVLYFLNSTTFTPNMLVVVSGVFQLIIGLIVIVALAIIYKVGYNYLYKLEGWPGFIINLIFYIPCMLLDLFGFLKNDIKQAPKSVVVLLIVELILILLYLYAPKVMNVISKSMTLRDGKAIITEPVKINTKMKPSSYMDLQNVNTIVTNNIVNNKFAFSMWVYIVPIEPSSYPYNSDATIFEFENFHPKLIYNGSTGKFKAFYNQSKYDEFEMPLQKWNHVVFNYTKSNVDLFVNGELQSTYNVRDVNNESLSIGDIVSVGQDNGLSGGLCNLVYFNHPLLKYEIKAMYDFNKNKDPPM